VPGHVSSTPGEMSPAADASGEAVPEQPPALVRRLRPAGAARLTTGRERHDEKITVYVSPEELVAIEQARLVLRAEHGIAVDRGRLVREAVAEMLIDLDAHGAASVVVQRLRSE
jgi:hypothetical protein